MDINIGVRKIENGYILAIAGGQVYDLIGAPLVERHYESVEALAAELPQAIASGFEKAEKQQVEMAAQQQAMPRYHGEPLRRSYACADLGY
jgi:hypothetical protein